jgi:ATP-dependent Clp protease adaptor protein ClpS
MSNTSREEQFQDEILEVLVDRGTYELVLHNDDYHTFDFVIEILEKHCEHTEEQAEQCAWIVHNNGKCQIKRGSFEKLKPMHTNINRTGLLIELKKEK